MEAINMEPNAGFFAQRTDWKEILLRVEAAEESADAVLQSLRLLLDDSDLRRELFRLMNLPLWIGPLDCAGLFEHPQPVEQIDGGVRYARWPASQYLARMAALTAEEVADIFARTKTDNPAVVGDILAAANTAEMPANVAVTLVPTICEASKADVLWAYYSDATKLCFRLASSGQEDAAMSLAETLYGLQHPASGDRDHYWYKEGLKKVLPVLTNTRTEAFLNHLCHWLCVAIKAARPFRPSDRF